MDTVPVPFMPLVGGTFTGNVTFAAIAYFGGASGNFYVDASGNVKVQSGKTVTVTNNSNTVLFVLSDYFIIKQTCKNDSGFQSAGGYDGNQNQPTFVFSSVSKPVVLGASSTSQSGYVIDMAQIAYVRNVTAPASNPTGGGYLYVEAGALKYRGPSGTITPLGAA